MPGKVSGQDLTLKGWRDRNMEGSENEVPASANAFSTVQDESSLRLQP
jgi:hypothetical protein